MQRLNCALYTRKSSDEGLDMTFNSLEAQREACEAYVASQKHEGWKVVPTLYDDGGFSGGSMERPGLKALMKDIEAGRVNVVVVYKVDRLTRSLADFAKIVELFDSKGVSFVSVTQQFNTTSSMGRLTLNVLLSFAQFEREVTGERIRDKIAASKRKGMWMGGPVPLGYRVESRLLKIVPGGAEKVRQLYQAYLRLGGVDALKQEIGSKITGKPISRGALYALLQNPIYIGKIRHKELVHDGQHEPIMEETLWQQVQEMLAGNRAVRTKKRHATHMALTGIIFDEAGERLTPMATTRNGKRYSYYVGKAHGSDTKNLRIPAGELERVISDEVDNAVRDITKVVISTDSVVVYLLSGETKRISYRFIESGPFRHLQTTEEPGMATDIQKAIMRKLVIQGLKWNHRLFEENDMSVAKLAAEEKTDSKYLVKVISAVTINPETIANMLNGSYAGSMTTKKFLNNVAASF